MISTPIFRVTVSDEASDIGGQRVQQDNGLWFECVGQDGRKLLVTGVFDGHGRNRGQVFSQLAVEKLGQMLSSDGFKERFDASPEAIGREIFSAISSACFDTNCAELTLLGHEYMVEDGLIKPLTDLTLEKIGGGTTGTVVFVSDTGTVHTFNVGDSDAWLVTGENAVRLNANHSPDSESEYDRVHAIAPETEFTYHYQVACGFPRRKDGSHVFPKREDFEGYYIKNVSGDWATLMSVGLYSLAMTRSFGDEPLRHGGLSAEPSYSVHQVTDTSIVQLASDGFWDNIQNVKIASETVAIVQKHGYDVEKLNRDWFEQTCVKARTNFGSSRDNMWGYTIVLEKM